MEIHKYSAGVVQVFTESAWLLLSLCIRHEYSIGNGMYKRGLGPAQLGYDKQRIDDRKINTFVI